MKKKILVIDDEELLTKSFSTLLERQGYEVYTVRNGLDAKVMVEEEAFDLIISDVRMPGKDGVETIKGIQAYLRKENRTNIPIIFITGYADKKAETKAKELKPVSYLLKPFDNKEFLKIVKSAIRL